MYICLTGEPIHQQRTRTNRIRGKIHWYNPNERDKHIVRHQIRQCLAEHYPDFSHFKAPRVSFLFQMSIPKTMPMKLKVYAKQGFLKHLVKPDVDNLVKFYLDAMNELIFKDDAVVMLGVCAKTYHETPKTIIHIQETQKILEPWELSQLIYNPDSDFLTSAQLLDERTAYYSGLQSQSPALSLQSNDKASLEHADPAAFQEFLALWHKAQESCRPVKVPSRRGRPPRVRA